MGFRLEALSSLSRLAPDLVAAARERVMSAQTGKLVLEGFRGPMGGPDDDRVIVTGPDLPVRPEAIILRDVRPPLLVRDGTYVLPSDALPEVRQELMHFETSARTMAGIHAAIALAGRIAFVNVPGRGHHGTGWVIRRETADRAIVVTNRHVAEAFAYADGRGSYNFRTLPNYSEMALEFDFRQEHGNPDRQDVPVVEVLFMAPSRGPDIALLRVRGPAVAALTLPVDRVPEDGAVQVGMSVGVVGYPGFSPDADPADLYTYFRGIFDVKRIGFGLVRTAPAAEVAFTHDATTLGGNSGSVVFDTETGGLVGLHFGGIAGTANYAVNMAEVLAALRGLDPRSVHIGRPPAAASAMPDLQAEAVSSRGQFAGRDGYRAGFLGGDPLLPPGPGPKWQDALATATDDDTGAQTTELKYRHFSVWMCRARLLPLVSAVNIDGMQAKRPGRADDWFLDHRLPPEAQIDDRGYKSNLHDRSQFVRREDPTWGEIGMAQQASRDSFCLTNADPRAAAPGQEDWLRLEDHVLAATRVRGLKLSVFSGPVFRDDDPVYRKTLQVPRAFWKIIAVVDDATGALSVTGHVLTQGDLIRAVTQDFVHGAHLCYQVPVALIREVTGLAVDHLIPHDPLPARAVREGTGDWRFRVVRGPGDLRM